MLRSILSSMRTRIKICGIRTDDALLAAADEGADAVGFVFIPESPGFIDPEEAFALSALLPPFVSAVGVFADPAADAFAEIEQVCPTAYTQLDGLEDPRLVKAVGPDIIKTVRFDERTIRDELLRWDASDGVAAILVHAAQPADWSTLPPLVDDIHKPIIIRGGLTPANVEAAIRAARPYAVDVSDGVERGGGGGGGEKDPDLIAAFCRAVRRADSEP